MPNTDKQIAVEAASRGRDPKTRKILLALSIFAVASACLTGWALYHAYDKERDAANAGLGLAAQVEAACNDDVPDRPAVQELCDRAKDVVENASGPAVGPQGPKGDDGRDAVDGIDGVDGLPGKQGPQGPRGPQGPAGQAGRGGSDGRNGENGTDGETVVGPQGPVGPVGPQGPAGPKGDTGDKGEDGADGADGVMQLGEASSCAPGWVVTGLALVDGGTALSVTCEELTPPGP